MGYIIPQDIEYNEKFFGRLDGKQTISVLGMMAAVLFLSMSGLSIPIKAPLIALSVIMGIGFAFLKFDQRALDLSNFYGYPRKLGYLDPRMRSFVFIRDIKHDTIYLKNSGKRAILQVKPINFALKSAEDKKAIIASYRKFIDSLDFPIQILGRTVNMELRKYTEERLNEARVRLIKEKKQHLLNFFEDSCAFLLDFIDKNAVKNRLFYVVIPAPSLGFTDKERKEKDELAELKIRVQICKEGLATMGVSSERLPTKKLVSLFASYYDGYIEIDDDYRSPVSVLKKYTEEKWNRIEV